MSWFLVFFLLLTVTLPATASDEVSTVPSVDLERYSGKWYEVARLPNRFQSDCVGATAEYNLMDDGRVRVVNTCYREDGSVRDIEGVAKVVDESGAKLQVRFGGFFFKLFGWLIKPNYWVLDLAADYSYAVVGTPDRKYLWVLSRERVMNEELLDQLLHRAAQQGYEIERILSSEVPAT